MTYRWLPFAQWLSWGLLVLVLLRTAWVGDDAYITMRCVDNAVHGYGFTYNPVERVQAFTHPLWALALLPLHALFQNEYYELLGLNLLLAITALVVVGRSLRLQWAWLALPWIVMGSKAWMEYASSGLENALSYFLVALFVVTWWRWQRDQGSLLRLSLLASLLMLTRMDLILLVGPALAQAAWQVRSWRALRELALGFAPFFLWEAFALLYYGFPFPNTAYAKLGTQIDRWELMRLGWHYVGDSLQRDWVTLPIIGVAIGLAARRGQQAMVIGLVLYGLYVVRIGGDFMSGRYFAVLFLVALMVLGRWMGERIWAWGILAVGATILGLLSPTPMLLSGKDFAADITREQYLGETGVNDERAFYYYRTGLLHDLGKRTLPYFPWAQRGMELRQEPSQILAVGNVGMIAYFAGPKHHFVDLNALTDPLLAHIPAVYTQHPKPGHYLRRLPLGYMEGVTKPRHLVQDPALTAMSEHLRLITRGPIFSWQRLRTIFEHHLGLLPWPELHHYRFPKDQHFVAALLEPISVTVADHASAVVAVPAGAQQVRLQVHSTMGCEMVWLRGTEVLGAAQLALSNRSRSYVVPEGATELLFLREGYDYRCEVGEITFDTAGLARVD